MSFFQTSDLVRLARSADLRRDLLRDARSVTLAGFATGPGADAAHHSAYPLCLPAGLRSRRSSSQVLVILMALYVIPVVAFFSRWEGRATQDAESMTRQTLRAVIAGLDATHHSRGAVDNLVRVCARNVARAKVNGSDRDTERISYVASGASAAPRKGSGKLSPITGEQA